jgi:hypothetical protein
MAAPAPAGRKKARATTARAAMDGVGVMEREGA